MGNAHGLAWSYGSSPRAWGTHLKTKKTLVTRRFIPTRVGNTASAPTAPATRPVHPHARGEHQLKRAGILGDNGSSPRAWGTQLLAFFISTELRFIPTRVGNTGSHFVCGGAFAVHPHARGEHAGHQAAVFAHSGSSPRAWGTRGRTQLHQKNMRFIPTRVGNTIENRHTTDDEAVHPHARGEHRRGQILTRADCGSSPRAWGTPICSRRVCLNRRFIPTRVGNTPDFPPKYGYGAVHPHARGEHGDWLEYCMTINGSSPRAWGTLG